MVKRARQLRADEVEALIGHYRENGSVAAAARAFDITRQTAAKHLADAGMATVRRMSEAEIVTAVEQYARGDSAATIGRILGFDAQTVLTSLRGAGVRIRPRPGYPRPSQ